MPIGLALEPYLQTHYTHRALKSRGAATALSIRGAAATGSTPSADAISQNRMRDGEMVECATGERRHEEKHVLADGSSAVSPSMTTCGRVDGDFTGVILRSSVLRMTTG